MKSLIVKRSVVLAGHKTSVSLGGVLDHAERDRWRPPHHVVGGWSVASISSANTVISRRRSGYFIAGLLPWQGGREAGRPKDRPTSAPVLS